MAWQRRAPLSAAVLLFMISCLSPGGSRAQADYALAGPALGRVAPGSGAAGPGQEDRSRGGLDHDLWPLDQFLEDNPRQALLLSRFTDRVQGPPVPATLLPEDADGADAAVTIVVVPPEEGDVVSWRQMIDALDERLAATGLAARVQVYRAGRPAPDKAQGGELFATTGEALAAALATAPDYLVTGRDMQGMDAVLGRLLARGHPRVVLVGAPLARRSWAGAPPLLIAGPDDAQAGALAAEQHLAQQGAGAAYAVIAGHAPGHLRRLSAYLGRMRRAGAAAPVAIGHAKDGEQGTRRALEALAALDPPPQVVFTTGRCLGSAVVQVLAHPGKGNGDRTLNSVTVIGWKAPPAVMEATDGTGEVSSTVPAVSGTLTITVDSGLLGRAVAEAVVADRTDRGATVPQVMPIPFSVSWGDAR